MGQDRETQFRRTMQAFGEWFRRQKRVLPWRSDPSLYRVWISEIMLQQTQVVTVVPYFEKFVARFPTVEALAAASEDDVMLHWAGLGYYSRARNLHRGAKRIAERGHFPRDREGWLEVPGVGPYTAGAITSIALNAVEPILDGNVERVLSRLRCVGRERGDAHYKAHLWALAAKSVRLAHRMEVRPSEFNQALMELGATLCSPRSPRCDVCPVAGICRAKKRKQADLFPPKKKRAAVKEVHETVVALFDAAGRLLVRKRGPGEWRAGLWDLPERSLLPNPPQPIAVVKTRHIVTHHRIHRLTEVARVPASSQGSLPEGFSWVDLHAPGVPLGAAVRRTLAVIEHECPGLYKTEDSGT